MKRIISKGVLITLCMLLVIATLCGCNMSSTNLPKGMDPDKALSQAQGIAMSLSKGEYDKVAEQFSDNMKAELTVQDLRDALEDEVEKRGAVTKILSWSTRGASDDETGEYAVFVLVCKCEKGSATFTICLDKESKICGLYMR